MAQTEYIEFPLNDENRFGDLLNVYNQISLSKKSTDYRSDAYWLDLFPDYALEHYYFSDSDLKPGFETAADKDETWHFYSMIEYLVENLDVELMDIKKIDGSKGRLDFMANGYPYGGISGLIMFLNSFGFKACKIDEGGFVADIKWPCEIDFQVFEIE